jgi:hypothetical protein
MLSTPVKLLQTRTMTMTRQPDKNTSGLWGALALWSALLLGASGAQAATVTITDCATDPHIVVGPGGNVTINVGADDLELKCALVASGPSSTVLIQGHDVSIQADVKFPGRPILDSIGINASGSLEVLGAIIEASNNNASIRLASVGDITLRSSSVRTGEDRYGQDLRIQCTGPRCAITARQTSFTTRHFSMVAEGDIYFGLVKVVTESPRDRIDIVSQTGSAMMSGCGNTFRSGPEGRMSLQVCQQIDLAFARIDVAEYITIQTMGGCGELADIRLAGATVRNDFGKIGEIVITAGDQQAIDIGGATIVDDERSTTPDVAELNGRAQVPHEGFNNVIGTPDLDD